MTSRRQTVPSSSRTEHTPPLDVDKAIAKLRNNIVATRKLETGEIEFDDPRVDVTQKTIRETIRDIFGADSSEYYDHSQHRIWHGSQIYLEARDRRQQKFSAGIPHTIDMLEGLILRLEDRRKPAVTASSTLTATQAPVVAAKPAAAETVELPRRTMTNRVGIIHGHNGALKNAVAEYLVKLGLEPVVLHSKQYSDRNILEKIESLPEVDFATVLLTADDFSRPGKQARSAKTQRNVLFELGYYVGRLGKSRVCALYTGHNKPPRDYDGVNCLMVSENQVWRRLLGLELKAAGFDIGSNSDE